MGMVIRSFAIGASEAAAAAALAAAATVLLRFLSHTITRDQYLLPQLLVRCYEPKKPPEEQRRWSLGGVRGRAHWITTTMATTTTKMTVSARRGEASRPAYARPWRAVIVREAGEKAVEEHDAASAIVFTSAARMFVFHSLSVCLYVGR